MQTTSQDPVFALALSPAFLEDGICFAARSSGLYRSEDGGGTWRLAYENLEPGTELATTAVALSGTFDNDGSMFVGVPGVIMRSFQAGASWHYTPIASPPPIVAAIGVSPNFIEDGTLLVGTMEDGIFRSEDRGVRWMACNFGLTDLSVLTMAFSPGFASDDTVYLGTESGIFYSTNGGRAWKESGFPVERAPVLCLAVSPDHNSDGILWAGTESKGLFMSADRGETWQRIAADEIPDVVNALAVSSQYIAQPDLLVMTSQMLLVSRDGGDTWSQWSEGLLDEEGLVCLGAPASLEPGTTVLVGTSSGTIARIASTN